MPEAAPAPKPQRAATETIAVCTICPHRCARNEGEIGLCGVRVAREGRMVLGTYGATSALSVDPIEKKPFARFHRGTKILSWGGLGCNMTCPFCQNDTISCAHLDPKTLEPTFPTMHFSPEQLVEAALDARDSGNIGLAFTYNEPIISYEYVRECAALARREGLVTAAVTNGYATEDTWAGLCDVLDAVNIDLKAFDEDSYRRMGGGLAPVEASIATAVERGLHVEVTTLVVPGISDDVEMFGEMVDWLARLDKAIPLHLSRFFPRHEMRDASPTDIGLLQHMQDVASKKLDHVYVGNV